MTKRILDRTATGRILAKDFTHPIRLRPGQSRVKIIRKGSKEKRK